MDTTRNVERKSGYQYEVTMHEYCILTYFQKYDKNHFDRVLKENEQQFMKRGVVDNYLKKKFIIDNIQFFSDEKLFDEIAKRAIEKFDSNLKQEDINPFNHVNRKKYLDIDNEYGGVNFLTLDNKAFVETISKKVIPELQKFCISEEVKHFEQLIDLSLSSAPFDKIIDHLDIGFNLGKGSAEYKLTLEFASNCYAFYNCKKDILGMPWKDLGFVALADLGGFALGSKPGAIIGSCLAIYDKFL